MDAALRHLLVLQMTFSGSFPKGTGQGAASASSTPEKANELQFSMFQGILKDPVEPAVSRTLGGDPHKASCPDTL